MAREPPECQSDEAPKGMSEPGSRDVNDGARVSSGIATQRQMPWTNWRNSAASKPFEARQRWSNNDEISHHRVGDVEMGAEEPCAAQVQRAKTINGLEICVLEAQDDVYDETRESRRTRLRRPARARQTKTSWRLT